MTDVAMFECWFYVNFDEYSKFDFCIDSPNYHPAIDGETALAGPRDECVVLVRTGFDRNMKMHNSNE